MTRRRRIILIAGAFLITAGVAGYVLILGIEDLTPDERDRREWVRRAEVQFQNFKPLLEPFNGVKATLLMMDSRRSKNPQPATHIDKFLIELRANIPDEQWKRIQSMLRKPNTFQDEGNGAMCFDPGMAIRLEKDGKRLDLLICLDCFWIYVYSEDGTKLAQLVPGAPLWIELNEMYKELFPKIARGPQ